MNGMVIVAAGFCGLLLAGTAASLLALVRVRWLAQAADRRARLAEAEQDTALADFRRSLDALAAQFEEMRALPHIAPPTAARPGMNLSRRSHALRLYRRGEPAGRIAQELGIPLKEVELLIKVHEIVLSTV
jgi:hypothetical protein